ncbi:MAG: 50S ribosomal protein L10 [Rickettsiaceae bacterium]|nr:50S ribosomal protein L10 [Rickettsiaceae bacterium]
MPNIQKKDIVQRLQDIYDNNDYVIFAHYHGLNSKQLRSLRSKLKESKAKFTIVKNTLSNIAANNVNIKVDEVMTSGPMAIAYSASDPVNLAKTMIDFAKVNENLKLVGGVLDKAILSTSEVVKLSALPSLATLRASIVGLLQAPALNLVRTLSATPGSLVRVIKAKSEKGE